MQAIELYCALAFAFPFAAKIDPVKCFDNMDRDVLHKALMALIPDEKLVQFVMKLAKRPLWIDKEMFVSDKGILQGSPLSPLLCNVYFHSLDLFLEQSSIPFIRFADDLIIFSSDLSNAQANYSQILDYLTQHLHLVPNKRKCKIAPSQELTFLGCRFKRNNKGFIICDKPDEKQEFFSQWYDSVPKNNRRRFDILSDGILRQKEFTLFFEKGDGKTEIPSRTTDTINVYSNVVFDSGVLQKALSAGIQINLFSKENHLVGRIIPNKPLKSPKTTYEQLMAYYSPTQRVKLASDIILASVHNTRLNIRYYNKQYPDGRFDICLAEINRLAGLVRKESSYEKLLLLEAKIRKAYYNCYDLFLRVPEFSFEKRTRRPPENELNALISFGNTILYNLVASLLYRSSLDIRIGFLHATTGTRAETLNLDIAEIFKPLLVDRVIFSLINKRTVTGDHFHRVSNNGVYLTSDGIQLFLSAFYEKLDTVITVGKDRKNYHQVLRDEIAALTRYFRNHEPYKPFKQVR